MPAGLTIAEIIDLIQPDLLLRAHGVAFIGEHLVPRDRWHRVRPQPGALLSIRLLPSGGGGLRIGLMILVAVAAIALTIATAGATSPLLFVGPDYVMLSPHLLALLRVRWKGLGCSWGRNYGQPMGIELQDASKAWQRERTFAEPSETQSHLRTWPGCAGC